MKGHVPKVEKEEEKQWILNVLDGHKEDYSYLVNRYKNKIYGLLRGMGADHQDAQDITQETFIKAYRKQPHMIWIKTLRLGCIRSRLIY